MAKTVSVRLSEKRYKELRKLSLRFGPSISWYLNAAVDMLLQKSGFAEKEKTDANLESPVPTKP